MAKSNNQKGFNLSPRNYIRQRARALPIHECLVNKNWQISKMVTVTVSRKHVNGNVTVGNYLVDLLCLGVKDTSYAFNISLFEYADMFIRPMNDFGMELEKIDYTLAHNIIYAGIDFATHIGLKPHADFLKTTQFLLDEDDDKVELVEVECGHDGLPAVVVGDENRSECERIIAKLDGLVGKGNYTVIDALDDSFDEPEEEPEEYTQEQFEADKKIFRKGFKKFRKPKPDDIAKMLVVTRRLFYRLVDDDKVDEAYENMTETMDVMVSYDDIPDEFLGVPSGSIKDEEWVKSTLVKAFDYDTDEDSVKQLYAELLNSYPDMPAVGVLDLFLLSKEDANAHLQKLEEYRIKYPDYELFNIINYSEVSDKRLLNEKLVKQELRISSFFNSRETLFWVEMFYFIRLYSLHTLSQGDPVRVGALYDFLHEEYLPEEATIPGKLTSLLFMSHFVGDAIK